MIRKYDRYVHIIWLVSLLFTENIPTFESTSRFNIRIRRSNRRVLE